MGKNPENPEAAAPGVGPAEGADALEEIKRQAKRARRSVDAQIDSAHERRLEAEIEALYAGDQWSEVGALYFNIRYGLTGSKIFRLEDREKERLGNSLALMMRILIKLDPRYLALLVFTVNFTTLIAEKEALYYAERLAEAKDRQGN